MCLVPIVLHLYSLDRVFYGHYQILGPPIRHRSVRKDSLRNHSMPSHELLNVRCHESGKLFDITLPGVPKGAMISRSTSLRTVLDSASIFARPIDQPVMYSRAISPNLFYIL